MLPDVNLIGKACYEGFRLRASAPVERSVAVPRSALPWSELPDSHLGHDGDCPRDHRICRHR
jgi:hypothetical protein